MGGIVASEGELVGVLFWWEGERGEKREERKRGIREVSKERENKKELEYKTYRDG